MMAKTGFFARDGAIYCLAGLTSLLLSVWIPYHQNVVNSDAVCYLLSAKDMAENGIRSAMQLCGQAKWPFYSWLIYVLVQVTHLSYTLAAYILNALFSLLSVLIFVRITKVLGGEKVELVLAAIVILLWHEFNGVREYIIRDHGFWAFYLLSLFYLIRFFQAPRFWDAIGWNLSLLVATLFRIEGAIFLLTLPFLAFFSPHYSLKRRGQFFFQLYLPTLLAVTVLIGWLLWHPQQTLSALGRLNELPAQAKHGVYIMAERYHHAKQALAQYTLGPDAAREAGLVLWVLLVGWYLLSIVQNLSLGYAILVVYAWLKRVGHFDWRGEKVLLAYLAVNIFITFGFLMERFFLSKRYLIALSLILLCWIPPALQYLLRTWPQVKHRTMTCVAGLLISLSAVSGIIDFGYSKFYIQQGGEWLAKNVPANASIYINDFQLMYYSQQVGKKIFLKPREYFELETIAHQQWKQYDYLALRIGRRNVNSIKPLTTEFSMPPIQVFKNKRGDKVEIYKIH